MSIASLPVVDLTASSSQQLHEMTTAADKAGFFFVKPTPQQCAKISSLTFALKEAARVHVFDQSMERKYQLACGDMQASRGWEMSSQHLAELRPCPSPLGWQEPSVGQGIITERFCSGPLKESDTDPFFYPTPRVTLELDQVMREYYEIMESLSENLHEHLASLLGVHIPLQSHCSNLQIANYPSQLEIKPVSRVKEHADSGTLTILNREQTSEEGRQVGGLQLLVRGEWKSVASPPGTLTVNFGNLTQRLSQGRVPSTKHRVLNPRLNHESETQARNQRTSFAFFVKPDPNWMLPACGDEPAVTCGSLQRVGILAEFRRQGLTPTGAADAYHRLLMTHRQ